MFDSRLNSSQFSKGGWGFMKNTMAIPWTALTHFQTTRISMCFLKRLSRAVLILEEVETASKNFFVVN